jgi:hypothetical protein
VSCELFKTAVTLFDFPFWVFKYLNYEGLQIVHAKENQGKNKKNLFFTEYS